jgi:hypothetical protein
MAIIYETPHLTLHIDIKKQPQGLAATAAPQSALRWVELSNIYAGYHSEE